VAFGAKDTSSVRLVPKALQELRMEFQRREFDVLIPKRLEIRESIEGRLERTFCNFCDVKGSLIALRRSSILPAHAQLAKDAAVARERRRTMASAVDWDVRTRPGAAASKHLIFYTTFGDRRVAGSGSTHGAKLHKPDICARCKMPSTDP
jgi:hypothetical protein